MSDSHICRFNETGKVIYTGPLKYEEKCECGKIRWKTEKSIFDKTIIYEYEKTEIEDKNLIYLLSEIKKQLKNKL